MWTIVVGRTDRNGVGGSEGSCGLTEHANPAAIQSLLEEDIDTIATVACFGSSKAQFKHR